jgi:hypothetical protein
MVDLDTLQILNYLFWPYFQGQVMTLKDDFGILQ